MTKHINLGFSLFDSQRRCILAFKKLIKLCLCCGKSSLVAAKITDADVDGCEHNVLNYGLVVEEVKLLEYHADMLSVLVDIDLHIRDVLASEEDRAAGGVLHTVKAAKKCRLSAAGWAEKNYLLTVSYIKVNALKNVKITKGFFKSSYREDD